MCVLASPQSCTIASSHSDMAEEENINHIFNKLTTRPPSGQVVKNPPDDVGDMGLIPGPVDSTCHGSVEPITATDPVVSRACKPLSTETHVP